MSDAAMNTYPSSTGLGYAQRTFSVVDTTPPYQSKEVNEIFLALAKAQSLIQNPEKNARNPYFNSKYTTLDVGLIAVREALAAQGIAIFQRTYLIDKLLMVQTILGHSSGQWLSSDYPVIMYPAKPQEAMAALTYSRRASLFAAAGIAGEDDDGESVADTVIDGPKTKVNEEESKTLRLLMQKELATCTNIKALAAWSSKHGANKVKLTDADKELVTDDFNKLQTALKEKANG